MITGKNCRRSYAHNVSPVHSLCYIYSTCKKVNKNNLSIYPNHMNLVVYSDHDQNTIEVSKESI